MPFDDDTIGDEVVQWRLKMMTTQRFANLLEVADILGDMNADGIEIIRKIGSADNNDLRRFLRGATPETFKFLAGLRADEVGELANGIELVRAFKTTGRFMKWAIISMATMLAASLAIMTWYKGLGK